MTPSPDIEKKNAGILTLQQTSGSPGGLINTLTSGLTPGDPNSVGLGWDPRIHFSNKFPGTSDPACSKSYLV